MSRVLPFRRGLRSSVTTLFAVGALAISVALALGTYLTARHSLIEQRQRVAMRQTFSDAALLRSGLQTSGTQISDVLGDLTPPRGTTVFVHRRGEWYSSSLDIPPEDVTRRLLPVVSSGSAGLTWSRATRPASVVVGVPVPGADAEYFEAATAQELDSTLRTLRLALLVFAAITTLSGTLLGRAATRRALAPLDSVTQVAGRISAGDIEARMEDTEDPDLAGLVGAFNTMVDTVEERIQRDSRFAADVSHELRTPLTTLITTLSLLERAPDLSPRSEDAVARMGMELDRFRRCLEDLLALGRLDSEVNDSDPAVIGLCDIVHHALVGSGRSPDLLRCLGDDDPPVRVDRQQLVRALTNLFTNADTHGRGLTRISVVRRLEDAEVHVEDRGPGVDPEDRVRVFERFARAGSRGPSTGTGLGLSIVSQTLRNHGGTVWISDRPGGGAEFVIRLPVAPGEDL